MNHGDIAAIDGAAAFTMMGWFFIDVLEAGIAPDFYLAKDGACRLGNGAPTSSTIFRGSTSSTIFGEVDLALVASVWTHLAYVFDGSLADNATRLKLYKDGVQQTLVFTGTVGTTLPDAGAEPFRVMTNTSNAFFADGKGGLIKLWTVALSAAEVAQEMNSFRPVRTSGLIVWSPYDDGTNARDYSGNENHGVVTGALQAPGPPVSYGGQVRRWRRGPMDRLWRRG